jgi:hypothetical protein
MRIRCCCKVFAEPLPSKNEETHGLMTGIYELRRSDGLRCHDVSTIFHKDWFSHSEVDGVTQHGDYISLLLFFENNETRLKMFTV